VAQTGILLPARKARIAYDASIFGHETTGAGIAGFHRAGKLIDARPATAAATVGPALLLLAVGQAAYLTGAYLARSAALAVAQHRLGLADTSPLVAHLPLPALPASSPATVRAALALSTGRRATFQR
jgi:hypothetical protein